MKRTLKVLAYILAFMVIPLAAGLLGLASVIDIKEAQGAVPPLPASTSLDTAPAGYDPSKPIAVILLGDDVTEATDFLGPYELFAASKAYNVYVLAPQQRLTTLTGGLEVLPDMSLAEFDQRFGRNPDVIVTPNIPLIKNANNQPLVSWVKSHAGPNTVLFSWCVGAAVLAETGLLDGKTATTHWGDIGRLEETYPDVKWARGLRYVDEGNNIITIERLLIPGENARQAAPVPALGLGEKSFHSDRFSTFWFQFKL
jgi:putative intracellular protease/amidase